jgi:hypothetical protein
MEHSDNLRKRLEKTLVEYQMKCSQYNILHRDESLKFSIRNKIMNIVAITISATTATTSVTTASLDSSNSDLVKVINIISGVLLYFGAIVGSLQHFLNYEKNKEDNKTSSTRFMNLSNNIKRYLTINDQDDTSIIEYFKWVSTEVENIISSSPEVSSGTISEFEKKYGVKVGGVISTSDADIELKEITIDDNNIQEKHGKINKDMMKYEMERFLVNSYS